MSDTVTFTLDGAEVSAPAGQTIWDVTKGQGLYNSPSMSPRRTRISIRRQLPRLYGRGRRGTDAGRPPASVP